MHGIGSAHASHFLQLTFSPDAIFDTAPYIRTFESVKDELGKLRKALLRKIDDLEDNMTAAEDTYKTRNAELGESLEVCYFRV